MDLSSDIQQSRSETMEDIWRLVPPQDRSIYRHRITDRRLPVLYLNLYSFPLPMATFTRTILITGGTANLGYQAALSIARQCPDHQIVIASRTDPDSAAETINRALTQTNVSFMPLDLSSRAEVRAFADEWESRKYPPIQALVLNAGLQFPGEVEYTADGIEKTFAINHVGHALLFALLSRHLADTARIVVTASGTHDPEQKTGIPDAVYTTAEELAHPTAETAKNPGRQRYSSSKLANVLWGYALHKRLARLPGRSWTVASFDPGLMPGTGLARGANLIVRFLWTYVLPRIIPLMRLLMFPNIHTPEQSGAALAWLAVDPEAVKTSGSYYEGKRQIKSSKASYDEQNQEDLWKWTIENISLNEEESRNFDMIIN